MNSIVAVPDSSYFSIHLCFSSYVFSREHNRNFSQWSSLEKISHNHEMYVNGDTAPFRADHIWILDQCKPNIVCWQILRWFHPLFSLSSAFCHFKCSPLIRGCWIFLLVCWCNSVFFFAHVFSGRNGAGKDDSAHFVFGVVHSLEGC